MDQRLLGQDVTVRLVRDGVVVAEVTSIGSFDDSVDTEIKQEGFMGQMADVFNEVFIGYSGNLEFQSKTAGWIDISTAIIARATRADPAMVFNIVRSDLYADGSSNLITYKDVAWGPLPTNFANRKEFGKHKLTFKCSDRDVIKNGVV